MLHNTHCEAQLYQGKNWGDKALTGSLSGTPQGVIEMLFTSICQESIENAESLLLRLREELDWHIENK